jgi:DegT/DnrJ/EryC1/StrS aminotransferase family
VKVPLLDLKPQYRALKAELDAAILRVSESQYFILGPEVKALEAACAAYSGCKFGIGLSSGTDALLIARSHHQSLYVLRHRRHHRAGRRAPGVRGHRARRFQHCAGGDRALHRVL